MSLKLNIFDGFPNRADTWTDSFDWSGVNFASAKAGTAITPDIVVSAAHFGTLPSPLEFVTAEGQIISRSVIGQVDVGNDILVSRLNEPLPENVKIYQLPDPNVSYSDLVGGLAIYTNRGYTAQAGAIAPSGNLANLDFDPTIPTALWDELESGDSGSPSFIIGSNNEEVLFSTWWFNNESGPYYGDLDNQIAITDAIDQLGSTTSFTINSLI